MASTAKERFNAAVNVIHSLPKNGSFQPSHDLMLRFYAYYKQATLGPCNQTKPAFWEVVKKAKWEAWNGLGIMPEVEAMNKYVEELKQTVPVVQKDLKEKCEHSTGEIVETMPQTDAVGDFMETLGTFYELVDEKSPVELKDTEDSIPKLSAIEAGTNESNINKLLSVSDGSQSEINKSDQSELSEESTMSEDDAISGITVQVKAASSSPYVLPVNGGNTENDGDVIQMENVASKTDQIMIVNIDTQGIPLQSSSNVPNGNKSPINGGVTDSDSESEIFCDTTEPEERQVSVLLSVKDISSSTPLKPFQNSDDSYNITTEPEVHNWAFSPIKINQNGEQIRSHNSAQRSLVGQFDSHDQVDLRLINEDFEPSRTSYLRMPRAEDNSGIEMSGLLNGGQSEAVVTRGGGKTPPGNGKSRERHDSEGSMNSRGRGPSHPSLPPSSSQQSLSGGAGAGGGRDGSSRSFHPDYNVSEQIAVALVRLQQDMSNVLTRLQTLETLTIVQRQVREHEEAEIERQRREQNSWWPFANINSRTVFLILVWPLIVQWVISFLSKRRNHRR